MKTSTGGSLGSSNRNNKVGRHLCTSQKKAAEIKPKAEWRTEGGKEEEGADQVGMNGVEGENKEAKDKREGLDDVEQEGVEDWEVETIQEKEEERMDVTEEQEEE